MSTLRLQLRKGVRKVMPQNYRSLALLTMICVWVSSCGTITHGTRQSVTITSNPPGARATVDGVDVVTPNAVSLSRTKDYVVNVEKDGCQGGQAQINRSFNGTSTILGNILWLLPGVVVDLWAGGTWTLQPDQVSVPLAFSQKS